MLQVPLEAVQPVLQTHPLSPQTPFSQSTSLHEQFAPPYPSSQLHTDAFGCADIQSPWPLQFTHAASTAASIVSQSSPEAYAAHSQPLAPQRPFPLQVLLHVAQRTPDQPSSQRQAPVVESQPDAPAPQSHASRATL